MTISYVGAGGVASGTTTATASYPSTPTAGQLGVLQVVSGHPSDSIPSAPSGWTLAGSASGGGGTFGSGAGPRRLTFFTRVMAGSDATPTTTLPSGTGAVIAANAVLLARSAGNGWRWDTVFGDDETSGTGFSAAATDTTAFAPGDFCWIGYGLPLSTVTLSSQSASAAGVTFGTITSNRFTSSVTSGDGCRTSAASGLVSSGTATVAPTLTATLSASTVGIAGMLRLREASAAITATAQSTAFPPRILASVTGMEAEGIVSASIYRVQASVRTAVRASSGVDVAGADALLRVDGSQPFGTAVSYQADLTDVGGWTWTISSTGTVTSTISTLINGTPADVVSDEITGLGAIVRIEAPLDRARTRNTTTFAVGSRAIIVGLPRSPPTATVTVRTQDDDSGDALQGVLDSATEGTLLIRCGTTNPRIDGYYTLTDDTESPNWYDEYRWWALTTVQTEAWPDALVAAGFDLQDIADNYSTLQDIANANASLLLLAQRSF